ncbi:MAG: hypothetical protein CMJ83_12745 [Planctomycetes bacterium]|nr:hypothetical protein [Planctomycetota bacterium]
MGVTISFRGRQESASLRQQALDQARAFATEMEWGHRPLELSARRGFLGSQVLETPHLRGLSLIPHFACEPIPMLFSETTGHLLDAQVWDEGQNDVQLLDQVMVKTHFGGPEVHSEVCDFLANLKEHVLPDLDVDDETGFFKTADLAARDQSFDAAWDAVLADVPRRPEPGEVFAIGGFEFHGPRFLDPIGPEQEKMLQDLEAWLTVRYGGFGLTFERTHDGIENLDLLMHEADTEGWFDDLGSAEAEGLAHGLGATFGAILAELLGGEWTPGGDDDDDEGLVLHNVGRIGLSVDPFQIAAERIAHGPSHAFVHHVTAFEELARRLTARAE